MRHRLFAISLLALTACDESPRATPEPAATSNPTPGQTAPSEQPDRKKDATKEAKDEPSAAGDILVDPGAEDAKEVTKAIAVLRPLGDGQTKGTVELEQSEGGLRIKTTIEGLPGGKHAYHVHLLGDCSAPDGKSAGTHFHFAGPSKNPPEDIQIITGNLGDLEGDEAGKATHEATIEGASLQGRYSILGRSIIVHEKPNDPKDPPIGGAGGRIACGVVGITE